MEILSAMHLLPDDGFEHDTAQAAMTCPCEPYLESIPVTLGGLYSGSVIKHRDMRVPDRIPRDWFDESADDLSGT